jgi:hypothetical protein
MHEEDTGILPEEMIVQGGDFQPVVQQSRHHRIHFVLRQNEVSHHDLFSTVTFGHRKPATKAKRGRRRVACNFNVQVITRNIHLQDIRFVVP